MAAKKLTPQQARDRRAKIMLGVLGVVFVGVLALELPKVMGNSGGSAPAAAPATTTSATTTTAAAPVLASATSQLTHFSRFAAKDPFHAQAGVAKSPSGGAPAAQPAPTPKPVKPPKPAAPPLTISVTQQTVAPTGPRVPAALLMINGKKRVIALNAGFPAKQPIFRVVALSQNAIWIQLVGGSLGNGQQTIKLQKGRHVTLANTTIGLKLALALVKPTTAPAPPPSAPAPATTTTTPAQTTPTAPTVPTTTTTG